MNIIIKEKEYQYESDYPAGWSVSSGDYFKYPVQIGKHPCFIKRFEKKDPAAISGWDLLVKLKHKYETNLSRVYDIATVEEGGKRVFYVVYEFLQGDTLDKLIAHNIPVDLQKMTGDLFLAFGSLHKYGYWFADFTEKNIFLDSSGRFVLMDLDSAHLITKPPHDDMYGSKDYWALVFAFYKRVLGYADLRIDDLTGLSLNYLQILFLVTRLKLSYNIRDQEYQHPETYNDLPEDLDRIDPAFRGLFTKFFDQRKDPPYETEASEVQNLVIQKIINYQPQQPSPVVPEIESFAISATSVQKGESFELSWKVKDAGAIELYKNGTLDERFTPQDSRVKRRASYDGGSKEMTYKLVAIRGDKQVDSQPVTVQIVEAKPVVIVKPEKDKDVKLVDNYMKWILIGGGVLVVGVILFFLLGRGPVGSSRVQIENLRPRYIFNQNEQLTLIGKHFPAEPGSLQVILNGVVADIRKQTPDSVVVVYPPSADQSIWRGSVSVGMIIQKDTLFAPQNVFVLKNLAGAPTDTTTTTVAPDITPPAELPDEAAPGTLSREEKRKQDSLRLIQFLKNKHDSLNRQ